jgi:hypothetical protein
LGEGFIDEHMDGEGTELDSADENSSNMTWLSPRGVWIL